MSNKKDNIEINKKISYNELLTSFDKSQEILAQQIQAYEDKKLNYIKLILGLYGVLLPLTITILTAIGNTKLTDVDTTNSVFNNSGVMMVSGIALIVIGLLSLALLKYLIATKAGSAIVMRQINCNRQAIHAILLESFDGVATSSQEQFKLGGDDGKIKDDSFYWRMIGRHTRLPISNDKIRKYNCDLAKSLFMSPDGFLSLILSLLIICAFGAGAFSFLHLGGLINNSTITGVVSTVIVLLISLTIYYIMKSSWCRVTDALDCKSEKGK